MFIRIFYTAYSYHRKDKQTHSSTKFLLYLLTNFLRFIVTLFIWNCHVLVGTDLLGEILAGVVRSYHLNLVAVRGRQGSRALRLAGLVQ